MRENMDPNDDEVDNLDDTCIFCIRKQRVDHIDSLKPGNHICMGGKRLMINVNDNQLVPYQHHAIVKHVDSIDNTNYAVTMIHFCPSEHDGTLEIGQTTEVINLGYYEIYKIIYSRKTLSSEEIVARAESLLKSDTCYDRLSSNCEHFCHWCCIGNFTSYQVKRAVINFGPEVLKPAFKTLRRVATSLFDALINGAKLGIRKTSLRWSPLDTMAYILAYLTYVMFCHTQFDKDVSLGNMCKRCCRKEKVALWLRFFIECGPISGGIGYSVLLGIIIRNALHSEFRGELINVGSINNMCTGDVVSFKYRSIGIMHDGIVSNIRKISDTKVAITLIHYSLPILFESRMIKEEEFEFDFTKDIIKVHDYSSYNVHPPVMVLQRARQRLGEKKYRWFSNRSSHFCHWAKVREEQDETPANCPTPITTFEREIKLGEDISGLKQITIDHTKAKKHSTKTTGFSVARVPEEVSAGEVIQFKCSMLKRWHYAITTEVHHTERPSSTLRVKVVHYGQSNKLCEETFKFDLCYEDVRIYKYHQIHRFSRKDVIRKVRAKVGTDAHKKVCETSWKLVQDSVPKYEDMLIVTCDELIPGDVIIFYYWALRHAAVVTNIKREDAESNCASITIIHYALDHIFATRMVTQETVFTDLKWDTIYKRNYEGFMTYPAETVVERACSRLNETRFIPWGNSSWDLVHWAKVVQNPSIFTRSTAEQDITNPPDEEKFALLPETGDFYQAFQRLPVYSWKDLQPGIIVEYSYYWIWHQGILSNVDVRANTISVIHYGTNTIFSRRTIMEDTFPINLAKDILWMYRCSPNVCNTLERTVELAKRRLGEQQWGINNNSWKFCKACVLKESS